ncbi:MAG: hypothetical protein DCF20_16690 [Pseudanabaena sp.]|nr:MAG: hypothetical protein DCF20_16690 [Pseudanabaena sp.]
MSVLGLASDGLAQISSTTDLRAVEENKTVPPISTRAADLMPLDLRLVPELGEILSENHWGKVATPGETPEPSSPKDNSELPAPAPTYTEDPNAGLRIPPNLGEGLPIERVHIYLRNPTTDPSQDKALQQQLADTFGIRAGGNFIPLFADQGLNQVQRLAFVKAAEYRLYKSNLPGTVIVALLVTLQSEGKKVSPSAQPPKGMLVSGDIRDFPTLYQNDGALAKITLNGSVGIYSDTNPWFGNANSFVSGSYKPTGTITWGEFSLEPGLAGITRLGDLPLYLYGAGSYTLSGTIQPDIFRTDNRIFGDVEKLYGGLLVADPGSPFAFNLSAGRQIFQLNQGFLFSQFSGSANALDRAASYSNPRTAFDMTVLATLRWGNWRLLGFFLDPNELPLANTNTQYLGTSLNYNNNQGVEVALTYVTVPQSARVYALLDGKQLNRQGLQVLNPRVRLSSLFEVPGLWVEGEYAYEFNSQQTMAAHGGYLWLGYTANDMSLRPSLSYRFAGFSGDNPYTKTYERFDPLLAGGLSDWLQGISLGKVYNNSNSFSHRVTFKVQPSDSLSVSLDYYYRFADQLNNLGGNTTLSTLESHFIGHEVMLTTQYFLSQNFMLLGVGAIAFPGSAIRQAVNDTTTSPWITLQLSLFMFF